MRRSNRKAGALMMLFQYFDQTCVCQDAPVHQQQQLTVQVHGVREGLKAGYIVSAAPELVCYEVEESL